MALCMVRFPRTDHEHVWEMVLGLASLQQKQVGHRTGDDVDDDGQADGNVYALVGHNPETASDFKVRDGDYLTAMMMR